VSVGEGGKWTVLRHCRVKRRERGLSFDRSGWDWEECLRMGRGNVTLIGDIGEGTWEPLAEGGGHGRERADEGIKEKCCGTAMSPRLAR